MSRPNASAVSARSCEAIPETGATSSVVTKRKTLLFNGYGDQVASLYAGMDLKKNF